jgi:hypothetical protein
MVQGVKVAFRTREFEVPSLTFDEVQRFKLDGTLDKVPANGITVLAAPDSLDAAVTVVLAALRWNYPDLTREDLLREMDLGNTERIVTAVLGASGLTRRTGEGEANP